MTNPSSNTRHIIMDDPAIFEKGRAAASSGDSDTRRNNLCGLQSLVASVQPPTPSALEEHKQQMEEEEEEEIAFYHHGEPAACSSSRDLPADDRNSDNTASSAVPKPLRSSSTKPLMSVKSSLLPARSIRSTSAQADEDIRSLSFSKMFSFRIARADLSSLSSSLDIDDISNSAHQLDQLAAADAASNSCAVKTKTTKKEQQQANHICRSQSLPMSIRRFNSKGSKRVADSSTLNANGGVFRVSVVTPPSAPPPESKEPAEADQQDIAEEEAVCRICMVALSEGSETLKLECCCRGDLALAHGDCVIKWFSIKGNGNCDVCNQEVLNLPVTLRRIHSAAAALASAGQADPAAAAAASSASRYRAWQWHGTPILVIISMLAYFCFLEELLVGDHGTAALAISLPFACVLGLFSSLTTTKMVSRRYVWIYSAVQFLSIVLFTHLFYRYVRMQAVIAIILSTFAGFGVAICANAVLLQIMRWRARRPAASPEQAAAAAAADLESALPPP